MAKSGNANAQGDEIKGDLGRVRRRSKDIEHDLNSLAEAAAEWDEDVGGDAHRAGMPRIRPRQDVRIQPDDREVQHRRLTQLF